MITERDLNTAEQAADSALLLTTSADVSRAAKAWRRADCLGVDTEFVRERTFFAKLGLIQISDGQTVWLVDPISCRDLDPVREMFEDTRITKIFHSPSEDIEVLLNSLGTIPTPLIDTQSACALTGQPLQLSYQAAVQWLTDVEIAKDQTRSDWTRRPLKSAQLRYAALDVSYLPLLWAKLNDMLNALNRFEWLQEDMQTLIGRIQHQVSHGPDLSRIRGVGRLNGMGMAVFTALHRWREQVARNRDLPRGFIIKDPVLIDLAVKRPVHTQELGEFDGVHRGIASRYGEQICSLIAKVVDEGQSLPVIQTLNPTQRGQLKQLRDAAGTLATEQGIESSVIAAKRDLEGIIIKPEDQWSARLKGWRLKLLSPHIEKILS